MRGGSAGEPGRGAAGPGTAGAAGPFAAAQVRARAPISTGMERAPFTIVITGKRYACRVTGRTEAEAADTAELIVHQLRQQERVWPAQVTIECEDFAAAQRLAAYFAAVTIEPDLG